MVAYKLFLATSTVMTIAIAMVIVGCSNPNADDGATDEGSTANGVNCDVVYDHLVIDRLDGISVQEPTPEKISQSEKIRHLNELDKTSNAFIDVLRQKKLPIKLTGGAMTNFAEWASYKGKTPRGWEGTGYTWDSVPGTGTADGLFLGDSAKPNNAWSLAIHEGTHAVDRVLQFTVKNSRVKDLYKAELSRPERADDFNSRYRRSNIEEFLAVAVDEYYCSTATRDKLVARYPDMNAYIRDELDAAWEKALK
jgi:hypothetical protein